MKLISCAQNHEVPGRAGYFEVIHKTAKFLGVQRAGVTLKSCIQFHRPSHLHLHQLHHLQDCKLILQNKEDYKSPDVQRVQLKTLHYLLQVHLLNNAITSFSSCIHQKLTDASLTILMTNMQGRILKEKLKDTNGMRQGRSCSIQRMTNLKIVSNLQFLGIHFYSYYMFIHSYKYCIMYAQEFLLNIDYVCVHPGMLVYLYAVYAQEFYCCCTILFSQVCSSHY